MKILKLLRMVPAIGGAIIAIGASAALAEDIDIFQNAGGAGNSPNVLFVLDNSTNWSAALSSVCYYKENGVVQDGKSGRPGPFPADGCSLAKKFDLERCALYNVLDALPVNADGTAQFNGRRSYREQHASPAGSRRRCSEGNRRCRQFNDVLNESSSGGRNTYQCGHRWRWRE